ncbi:hypothetical protein DW878_06125, partial [Olsenella sp. AM39-30AC]
GDSLLCLRNTFTNFAPQQFFLWLAQVGVRDSDLKFMVFTAVACAFVFVVSLLQENDVDVDGRILGWNCVARGLFYSAVLGLIVVTSFLTQNAAGGFMYANF